MWRQACGIGIRAEDGAVTSAGTAHRGFGDLRRAVQAGLMLSRRPAGGPRGPGTGKLGTGPTITPLSTYQHVGRKQSWRHSLHCLVVPLKHGRAHDEVVVGKYPLLNIGFDAGRIWTKYSVSHINVPVCKPEATHGTRCLNVEARASQPRIVGMSGGPGAAPSGTRAGQHRLQHTRSIGARRPGCPAEHDNQHNGVGV